MQHIYNNLKTAIKKFIHRYIKPVDKINSLDSLFNVKNLKLSTYSLNVIYPKLPSP